MVSFQWNLKIKWTTLTSEDAYDYAIINTLMQTHLKVLGLGKMNSTMEIETLKKCTLSFYVKTSKTGTYSVSLRSNG